MVKVAPEDRILMIINDLTIHGTTRLQKYGFLLSMKHEGDLRTISKNQKYLAFYKDWKAYWYGPYSPCLQRDVKKCLETETVSRVLVDQDLNQHQYHLTIKGRVRWRRILAESPDAMLKTGSMIRNLQKVGLERLLRGIYSEYPTYTTAAISKTG